jgi:hypothetical protein
VTAAGPRLLGKLEYAGAGGCDNGAYELDALKHWRNVGFELRIGRRYTIEGFAEVSNDDVDEFRAATAAFGGLKVCFALPRAWQRVPTSGVWDVGEGADYAPGSWGGHSMWEDRYDEEFVYVVHTWYEGGPRVYQRVTWPAWQRYCDEAYSVVDAFDLWRKRPVAKLVDLSAFEHDVAEVTAA